MYTIEQFIADCMDLEQEELISIAIDSSHIITAMKLEYIEDCDDEIHLELCSGYIEDGCNVCDEVINDTWAKQKKESDIWAAIEFLKLYI